MNLTPMPVVLELDAEAWAIRITARWRASIESIIETGQLLIDAKGRLPHGEFGLMLETRLPFKTRQAQMLMAIASDVRLSNPQYVAHLPASWGTLYDLTRLSNAEIEQGIEQNIIRPDMERKEIELIRPRLEGYMHDTYTSENSDASGSPEKDSPRPHGESLQQGLDTSSNPSTAETTPHGEGSDAASVANPGAASDPGLHAAPGASEANPPMPNGSRAIMSSRQEPDDSLDYFPTPPWATRALIERVLPHLERRSHCQWQSAWEPACGEGHMAEVLAEYFSQVNATDIFAGYGYSKRPPRDFLDIKDADGFDWIITNPPFGDKTEAFVLKALQLAGTGVAMFVRLQWLETIGRYENIFRDHPPTLISFFAERVNLCKGRWEPQGGTATAYIWLTWIKGAEPRAPFWIPPGCREALTKPDDVERFTQKPVAISQARCR